MATYKTNEKEVKKALKKWNKGASKKNQATIDEIKTGLQQRVDDGKKNFKLYLGYLTITATAKDCKGETEGEVGTYDIKWTVSASDCEASNWYKYFKKMHKSNWLWMLSKF